MSSLTQTAKSLSLLFTQPMGTKYDVVSRLVCVLFILRTVHNVYGSITCYGVVGSMNRFLELCWGWISPKKAPAPRIFKRVDKGMDPILNMMAQKLVRQGDAAKKNHCLPEVGWSFEEIEAELEELQNLDHTRWEDGRVSGAVYHGGSELLDMQTKAIGKFSVSNPIHPDVFPGVRKMEAEIVAMILTAFNAPEDGAGVTTSGGTESILMACLAAREKAAAERGITNPEIQDHSEYCSRAFYKAAQYFKIKLHLVSCPAPEYKASVDEIRRLINKNTVLLVASAPNFPHGIVDDIPEISRLATENDIPLHVDCCLGSLVMAFLKKAGFPSPYEDEGGFDFRQPGVTSISVDTHKYGFAPKGSSVLLYRNRSYRNYQYFIFPNWSGGAYASPSMAGSRPGSLIASSWATLMKMGESGYINSCRQIVGAAKKFETAILTHPSLIPHIGIIGHPMASVIAFTSTNKEIETYDIADAMDARGWHLNALQSPPAIHCAFTIPTSEAVDSLITDLIEVIEEILMQNEERKGEGEQIVQQRGKSAALYGVGGSIDHSAISQFTEGFLDTLYKA
ncbi:sphinganine-1-phosphate aldolase BST1 [Aspergillus nomiae NRRL 13137]|uniref:sphinganine-1-phosphate aldolase n=1 Tax=Aspergillus nomiae NRRL (strain ATCC 15546 / NRRL 13137 / CBS 260.88 / M93) TaxID=1509407 RepID=A0A0L1JG22_ASPN3|nr:sphinganine-1-phosphate aldolase BST1 [Aspergillus nomiae NRRL 13137]KNG90714.1 sphinganine-1-phosphate aldolase BST1 [Aspergillus nomiae NRRL 13137]